MSKKNLAAEAYEARRREVVQQENLMREAVATHAETGLTPRQLAKQRAELMEALKHTARVLADWHKTCFNEIVADGGVTASDVIRQECGWHSARLLTVIANVEHGS